LDLNGSETASDKIANIRLEQTEGKLRFNVKAFRNMLQYSAATQAGRYTAHKKIFLKIKIFNCRVYIKINLNFQNTHIWSFK
jgi:hypothetical protein